MNKKNGVYLIASLAGLAILLYVAFNRPARDANRDMDKPLCIAVMDPLAKENACACVADYAQRDYSALAQYLQEKLQREVQLCFCGSIQTASEKTGRLPELLIGKKTALEYEARQKKIVLRHLAMLTGREGTTTLTGLFVALSTGTINTPADLQGRKLAIGTPDCDEKHAAALSVLQTFTLLPPVTYEVGSCTIAASDVVSGKADGAVISSYAMPLLAGCQTVVPGELKVIGETGPVPFIAVYATAGLNEATAAIVQQALLEAAQNPALTRKLESRHGFVLPDSDLPELNGWTDWGGRNRCNQSGWVPETLSQGPVFLWQQKLAAQSLGGIAATENQVIVSDKSPDLSEDIWRCLDPETGQELWQVCYPAPGDMDYTNAPRATAVIVNDRVYLLGAFGHLYCVDLASGAINWKLNLIERFGGEVPTWGFCSTPLAIDNKIIVTTAAIQSALVALDAATGKVVWQTPGNLPGYGNLIVAEFAGKRQIIGHDAITLGGWDIQTGRRLWSLTPPVENDFNVPTPLAIGERLLVATENNGTRLYAFNADGTIKPQPVAQNRVLAPDTASPVVAGGWVWGISTGGIFALDPGNGLKTVWTTNRPPFNAHASLIAGNGHLLVVLNNGSMALLPDHPDSQFAPVTQIVFPPPPQNGIKSEVWSQPALVKNRLFLRNENQIVCLLFSPAER